VLDDVLDVSALQVPSAVEAAKFVDDIPLVDVVPFMPPPSKVVPATAEFDVVALGATTLLHPVPLVPPMELPMLPMELDVVGEMDVAKPPGSSSTAPRGIPTGFAPTGLRGEPTAERGEVIPVVGIVVLTCAKLGSLDNTAIAMAISNLNDATLCSLCMGQPSVRVSRLRHRRQRRSIVTAMIAYAARPRF
jgi:hypothetical protein